ncbi:MAG: phosphatidate cytidylyltransferase [Flavobacteriales bacterium]
MLQRSISGLVFVVVLCGAILWSFWSLLALFSLIVVIGLFEFYKLRSAENPHLKKWSILYSGILAFATSVFISMPMQKELGFDFYNHIKTLFFCTICFPGILAIPIMITDMLDENGGGFQNTSNGIFAAFYIGIPFGLLFHLIDFSDSFHYDGRPILAFFILIWSNDTFAYLSGKFLGKHKLWERISPNKTIEGFLGGILFTQVAMQIIIRSGMIPELPLAIQIVIPLIVSVFGTLGDLSESLLKRKAGVKDSGQLMPGHGGVLDRFDGILLSLPVLGIFAGIYHLYILL